MKTVMTVGQRVHRPSSTSLTWLCGTVTKIYGDGKFEVTYDPFSLSPRKIRGGTYTYQPYQVTAFTLGNPE